MTKTIITIIASLLASSAVAQTPIASDFPNGTISPKRKYERPARTEFTTDTRDWTYPPADWIMEAINAGVPIGVGTKNIEAVCERAPRVNKGWVSDEDFEKFYAPVTQRCIEAQTSVLTSGGDYDSIYPENWTDTRKACMVKIALRNSRDGFTDWANVQSEAHLCKSDKRIAELDVKLSALPVKFTKMDFVDMRGTASETTTIVNVGGRSYSISTVGNVTTVRSSSDK